MGFTAKLGSSAKASRSGHQAEITAEGSGPWAQSFVDSVKQCIAGRAMVILVDVSRQPLSLKEILDPLLKLQQFVSSKGGRIFLEGMPADFEGAKAIAEEGIQKFEPGAAEISAVSGLEVLIKSFEEKGTLPSAQDLVPLGQRAKSELESILKELERRNAEFEDFNSYLKHLVKHQVVDPTKVKALTEMNSKEGEITKQRDLIPGLKKQMTEAKSLAETEDKAHKEFVTKSDLENKKKMDALKKELDAAKANQKKLESEVQKRIDLKKAEITKLEAAKVPKT
jgi:hypothetical protein